MPNSTYKNKSSALRCVAALSATLAIGVSTSTFAAATIVILNNDVAGVGFKDATVVAPVGGNTGTTLGQQRLIAFQAAANKWGATLTSVATITVGAHWTALPCTATTAVLGSAGTTAVYSDFPGAPFASTWYGAALTNKLYGGDADPATAEINANFNVNLGQSGCLTGTFFYLGLDSNHGSNIDLVTVLTHEFAHGLGFQTVTNGSTGVRINGLPSVYDRFLIDGSTGKSWLQMTDAERAASGINPGKLAWDGPQVLANAPSVLGGTPRLTITAPSGLAGNYEVGLASFGAALTNAGVAANVVFAAPLDGCAALTNAAAIAGKIALIDRGTCGFTFKVKFAQDAGAIAVLIGDNVAGDPSPGLGGTDATITIPAVRITQSVRNAIKTQLDASVVVNAKLALDATALAGADPFGKPLAYTPNPYQSGSSVSHWDTSAFPNQLMEPAINGDLTHEVTPPQDLTYSLMRDIGWEPSTLPSAIVKTLGDNQSAPINSAFASNVTVTTTPPVSGLSVTWTAIPDIAGAGGATFAGTGTSSAVTVTNAAGVATSPVFTANNKPGVYPLNATVAGAGTTSFTLRNTLTKGLDIDGNNAYDAATDGVLVVRYLLGMTGATLSTGALGAGFNPSRTADPALANYIASVLPYLDVDGNGKVDALTDGLMILRTLLGLSGTAVTQSALGTGAKRTAPADITAYIQSIKP